ncbi:hypothetical protein BCR34DRAFT_599891 [Clohesyomyces aquaticus]|uniref:N-acetylglucosamine-induced protein 1 n=1 Tax=Clohesyomyces aquaticus TaxID=1231657 RepID=A0A1Y1ZU11_9PLEO|nr:hypothetical protein BCR34DRAFT_599891 [Clohesyomyces aquaticus]
MTIDSNPHSEPEPTWSLDESSHPHTFQSTWKSNPDPTALPFPRDNPPFNLTAIDWAQLALTDDQFTAHTWADLTHLISIGELDELKRWPSALKAYLAWSTHVKANYGSATNYLLQQRLRWTPESSSGRLTFPLVNPTPFGDSADYKILRNDWTYAVEPDVVHIVVWLKQMLPVDSEGGLTGEGREMVEGFVRERFRRMVGEKREGEKVLWFKNTTNLQSVRSLEHVHVLVRGAGEEVLRGWLN